MGRHRHLSGAVQQCFVELKQSEFESPFLVPPFSFRAERALEFDLHFFDILAIFGSRGHFARH